MASWGRNPSKRDEASALSAGEPSKTATSARRPPIRLTSDDVLENALGIPVLEVPPEPRKANTSPNKHASKQGHGRSSSHPFPALFSAMKKPQVEDRKYAFESTDEDNVGTSSTCSPKRQGSPRRGRASEQELTLGRCMTCDSGAKWPKNLTAYRCMVCQTINDIKPFVREPTTSLGQRTAEGFPLSVQRTRYIIDRCLTSYLRSHLQHQVDDDNPILRDAREPITGEAHEQNDASQRPDISSQPGRPLAQTAPRMVPQPAMKSSSQQDNLVTRQYSRSSPVSSGAAVLDQLPRSAGLVNHHEPPYRPPPLPPVSNDSKSHVPRLSSEPPLDASRKVFKALEDYIYLSFQNRECVNSSFLTVRPGAVAKNPSALPEKSPERTNEARVYRSEDTLSTMDAKTLRMGEFAENGSWWLGDPSPSSKPSGTSRPNVGGSVASPSGTLKIVSSRSPKINWEEVKSWYQLVCDVGTGWEAVYLQLKDTEYGCASYDAETMRNINTIMLDSRSHIQKILLKSTENLLKRPGSQLRSADELRFLLIILFNPLIYTSSGSEKSRKLSNTHSNTNHSSQRSRSNSQLRKSRFDAERDQVHGSSASMPEYKREGPGQCSGIIKRIIGLLSNLNNDCHQHLVSWFARLSEAHFRQITELIGRFVTYRLTRQHSSQRSVKHDLTSDLIPSMSANGQTSSAALHAALGIAGLNAKAASKTGNVIYQDDWQVKAAARLMSLLSAANHSSHAHRRDALRNENLDLSSTVSICDRERAHRHGQILATSDFYNTLLDYSNIIADFESWEKKTTKFSFCQYPFFISIGAKIKILEYDARRQQEVKAREAFFDSIMTRIPQSQYLTLKIRRECLVEDSLKGVSEVVGSGAEETKKGLRIEFKGEEGVDAGGLRKEWFLLLVREVFNPEHGMFVYDEDSQFCYFNPHSFENSAQFFLVGVVLGLAIYNSTILDIALPPFAFKKLLASCPATTAGPVSRPRPRLTYTLDDLGEYRPALARGLRQLLEYDGDVEATFCRDFVADMDRYGHLVQVPLCPNGENRPVTNANRREFVDLYVKYLLDAAVARQFEPFKRGFWQVCAGNALSLFQPEEIELLVRGSEEPLDISSLRAVAIYDNWGSKAAAETELVILWFWESFEKAGPKDQRKLLSFITGSDRIPATGAANLIIKITCLGDDERRFPVARTCFNTISLYKYSSFDILEARLWRAVRESEGFGLK